MLMNLYFNILCSRQHVLHPLTVSLAGQLTSSKKEKMILALGLAALALMSTHFIALASIPCFYAFTAWRKISHTKRLPVSPPMVPAPKASPLPLEIPTSTSSLTLPERIAQKFNDGFPTIYPIGRKRPEERQDLYDKHIAKLLAFLEVQLHPETALKADVVYISIGHADVKEQIWPGFIFDELKKGHQVLSLFFENGWKYQDMAGIDMCRKYKEFGCKPETQLSELLPLFNVEQFCCGFPYPEDDTLEDVSLETRRIGAREYWPSKEVALNASNAFSNYVDKILSQGKTVIIGYHIDYPGEQFKPNGVIDIYNRLKERHIDHLHFLWGYQQLNLFTNKKLQISDFATESTSTFTKYGNLIHCKLG